jgi:NADH dehydrogenase FAD-containing subunit
MTAPHDEAKKSPAGDQRLDVVVVGGGPAGAELASTTALWAIEAEELLGRLRASRRTRPAGCPRF